MIFNPTSLRDAHLIELDKRGDERGFFARGFCEKELLLSATISCSNTLGLLQLEHVGRA